MQKEINSSVILGFLTFILTAVSLWGLWSMTPISGKYPELELMFCATYGAFIVMLIQILFLLRKPKNNNNIIVVGTARYDHDLTLKEILFLLHL